MIKVAEEFRDKTTRPNQLWQTDFTSLNVIGWGWYHLRFVIVARTNGATRLTLDDFSRPRIDLEPVAV